MDLLRTQLHQRDRKDLLWIAVGALLAATFALVAYDQLLNLHFAAWQLYDTTPSDEAVARALRGPVTGWYRPVTAVLALLAGGVAVLAAMEGRWRALVALVVSTLVATVGIEATQSAGQQTTPTSQVDEVAVVSVIWAVILGLVPLLVVLVGIVGLRRRS